MSGPSPPNLPPLPPGRRIASSTTVEVAFSGPLPPPEILRAYDDAVPGCAARIIAMAEQQGQHRRDMEQKLALAGVEEMRLKFREARFGQKCAPLLASLFVLAGTYIALHGHPTAGTAVAVTGGGVGIPPIITAFMRGKSKGNIRQPDKPPEQKGSSKKNKARR